MNEANDHPRHLTDLQLAAALVPGAAQPSCPVPGCTECAARLEEARATARQFHEEVLPRTLPGITSAAEKAEGEPKPRMAPRGFFLNLLRPAPIGAVIAAAAAVLLWVKWPGQATLLLDDADEAQDAGETGEPPYLGLKGGAAVRVYVRRGAQVIPLDGGGTVHPGDALRFAVDPRQGRYALVVSIDGAQQISVYFPFGGEASESIGPTREEDVEADGNIALPGSVELDATLGDERVWILLSDAPLAVAAVRPALERLAAGGAAAVAAATAEDLLTGLPEVRARSLLLHKTAR